MVNIVNYEERYATAFKTLNEAWITKYFKLEEEDVIALQYPQRIIDKGGLILVALYQNEAVGVCALKKVNLEKYEVSKFSVKENSQGLGIGAALLSELIVEAKSLGAKLLYLEGNTKLSSSIHLYQKFGFKEMNLADYQSAYERVDIVMELRLD